MKRKRGQRKSPSSDDTSMSSHRAVLPVATQLSNPEGPPATGAEYLLLVREEAAKCPDIVAAKDVDKSLKNTTVDPAQRPARWRVPIDSTTSSTTSQHLLPNKAWRTTFLRTFKRNRQRLQEYRTRAMTEGTLDDNYLLPKANDELGWLAFCYGNTIDLEGQGNCEASHEQQAIETEYTSDNEDKEKEASVELELNEAEQTENDPNDNSEDNLELAKQRLLATLDDVPVVSDQTTSSTVAESIELDKDTEKQQGVDPALSLIASLSHDCTINLLQFHANHFEALSSNSSLGLWLYALLLRVDNLLTGSEMAVLRSIARNCHTIRNQISSQKDDRLVLVHTIIIIIADYFGQRDMDYE